MKTVKMTVITAVLMVSLVLTGCATTTVSRVDADTQIDLSGHWNDADVRQVCNSLIEDALSSPAIDRYIKNYAASHGGNNPTIIVGTFENTSSERMDTTIISRVMRTAIINSGKLAFVEAGSARAELRAERNDQQANASESTAAQLGNETAANFMLQGTVKAVKDQAEAGGKKNTVMAYFVSASITDVERNTILWEGENNEVKKFIQQAKRKL